MDETAEARPEASVENPLDAAPAERTGAPPDTPAAVDVEAGNTPPSEEPIGGAATPAGVTPQGKPRLRGVRRLRAAWPGGHSAPAAAEPAAAEPAAAEPAAAEPAAAEPAAAEGQPKQPRTPLRSRPGFGLLLTGALIAVLLTGGATAGALVIPGTAGLPIARGLPDDASASTSDGGDDAGPVDGDEPTDQFPADGPSGSTGTRRPAGRPADALAAWAVPLAAKVGIPATALQAYGYAERTVARSPPTCRLSWTTLAGIGKIESDHGRGNGASLNAAGKSLPPIIGAPLDGTGGRDSIRDTDAGQFDNDRTWDRAVGPMQFIPSTWQRYAIDADDDGVTDPNDIDDATLAAATYLCAGGRDLSTAAGWNAAVLSYNAVRVYANDVFTAANDYGVRSRG